MTGNGMADQDGTVRVQNGKLVFDVADVLGIVQVDGLFVFDFKAPHLQNGLRYAMQEGENKVCFSNTR